MRIHSLKTELIYKKIMKNRILSLVFLLGTSLFSYSQINELGVSFGGSNYIGDVGNEAYISPNEMFGGIIYKWNITPRIAFRAQGSYIRIKGDDANSTNEIRNARGFSFRNTIKEFSAGIEFNYYDYSLRKEGWGSTPYLILEVAAFDYKTVVKETTPNTFETEDKIGFTVPVGIGYKTKLATDVGISFESKLRYVFADDLDYNNTKYPQLNFGEDSNDWYITVGINIVFGFGRKDCYNEPL